jgi:hypothetical protein
MSDSNINQLQESVEDIKQFGFSVLRSANLLRLIGYGLLIFSLFDTIAIFIPPQLLDPAWEFQTIGQLVERVPVPLIGMVLVFYGEKLGRKKWEIPLVKLLSWLTVLFAVIFFLLAPLGIVNTIRLNNRSTAQIDREMNQRMEQITQVKELLAQASSPAEMQELISRLDTQGRTPEITDSQQVDEIRAQVSEVINQAETTMQTQASEAKSNRRLALFKNSVKWNLGALLSGALFVFLFTGTGWARKM